MAVSLQVYDPAAWPRRLRAHFVVKHFMKWDLIKIEALETVAAILSVLPCPSLYLPIQPSVVCPVVITLSY